MASARDRILSAKRFTDYRERLAAAAREVSQRGRSVRSQAMYWRVAAVDIRRALRRDLSYSEMVAERTPETVQATLFDDGH